MKIIKKTTMPLIIIIPALLTGCASSMKSSFGCDAIANTSCVGMQQVNAIADNGGYGSDAGQAVNYKASSSRSSLGTANKVGQPVRYGEEVSKVWVAPYEDSQGNFHDSSNVYTVTKSGHWVNDPVKEIRAKG